MHITGLPNVQCLEWVNSRIDAVVLQKVRSAAPSSYRLFVWALTAAVWRHGFKEQFP